MAKFSYDENLFMATLDKLTARMIYYLKAGGMHQSDFDRSFIHQVLSGEGYAMHVTEADKVKYRAHFIECLARRMDYDAFKVIDIEEFTQRPEDEEDT